MMCGNDRRRRSKGVERAFHRASRTVQPGRVAQAIHASIRNSGLAVIDGPMSYTVAGLCNR